jgi:hypothetical protein
MNDLGTGANPRSTEGTHELVNGSAGIVSSLRRGPVKLPSRAIAKVSSQPRDCPFFNVENVANTSLFIVPRVL